MTAPDLLRCPFCRGESHIDGTSWRPSDGKEVAWVTCKGCGAYGPTLPVKEAIAAWNTRATPAAMTPEVAKLVEAAEEYIEELEWHYGGGATDLTRKYRAALAALRAGDDAHGGKDG